MRIPVATCRAADGGQFADTPLGTDHLPTCVDPEGCPLACRAFDALKKAIAATPALNGKVRFVTLSFDPARDTPDVMRRYAGSRAVDLSGGLRWYFRTTRSALELVPLVEGCGQDVRVTYDRSSGRARRELSHVLKVFLIDRAGIEDDLRVKEERAVDLAHVALARAQQGDAREAAQQAAQAGPLGTSTLFSGQWRNGAPGPRDIDEPTDIVQFMTAVGWVDALGPNPSF